MKQLGIESADEAVPSNSFSLTNTMRNSSVLHLLIIVMFLSATLMSHTRLTEACGGTFKGSSGVITSPNYPNNYDNTMECNYVIDSRTKPVVLTFEEFLTEVNCDILRIYSNESDTWAEFSGNKSMYIVEPARDVFVLNFITDVSNVYTGFKLSWTALDCNANFIGSSGILTSPNYPANYIDHLSCNYTIDGQSIIISLAFEDFSTEKNYDFVKVYDENNTLLDDLSGELGWYVVQSARYYRLEFTSDYLYVGRGFKASWKVAGSTLLSPADLFPRNTCIDDSFQHESTANVSLRCIEKFETVSRMECLRTCMLNDACSAFVFVDSLCGHYQNGTGDNVIGPVIWKRMNLLNK